MTLKRNKQARDELEKVPLALQAKIGSIVVHIDELLSPDGHAFDREVLCALLRDIDVLHWIATLDGLALLPKKRRVK